MQPLLEEILSGDALPLSQAAKLIPGHRDNAHVDSATVWRWVNVGSKTLAGEVVKLEAVRIGGRWLTSRAGIGRFIEALTPVEQPKQPRRRSEAVRRKSADAARRALRAAGM